MKFSTNQSGFTLVSVMVAVGLMGMLAVGMMKMNETQMKSVKNSETKNELVMLHSQLSQYLLDSEACGKTFGDATNVILSGSSQSVASIMNKGGNPVYSSGLSHKYGNNTISIESMTLKADTNAVPPTTSLNLPVNSSIDTVLIIRYKKLSNLTAQNSIKKEINLKIQKASSGAITCYSQLGSAVDTARQKACEDIGGVWTFLNSVQICVISKITMDSTNGIQIGTRNASNIFSNKITIKSDGKMGISNPNPTSLIDIINTRPSIALSDSNGKTFELISNANSFAIDEKGIINRFYINNTGNVGIGTTSPLTKLEINGELKLKAVTVGSSCSVTGSQAYNIATGAPVYCSTSPKKWTTIGGNSVPKGSLCGDYGGGWDFNGTLQFKTILCAGHDPHISCPTGYSTSIGVGTQNQGHTFCIKN